MSTFNQQILIGRLGRDVELRETHSGRKLAMFSVATDDGYVNQGEGEWVSNVNWHQIVVYREALASRLSERLRKGDMVFVQGRWEHSTFEDAKGDRRYSSAVVAQRVFLLREVRPGEGDDAYDNPEEYPPVTDDMSGPSGGSFDHPSELTAAERSRLVNGDGEF